MKKKQIHITESDIKNAVISGLMELTPSQISEIKRKCASEASQMNRRSSLITEMAVPKSDYKKRAEGLIIQILENWCLLTYCRISGDERIALHRNHWASELLAHMNNLASLEIKKSIGKVDAKIGALIEVLNDRDFNTSGRAINLMISQKFRDKEHIVISNNPYYIETIENWLESYTEVVKLIAIGDADAIREYVINL